MKKKLRFAWQFMPVFHMSRLCANIDNYEKEKFVQIAIARTF